MLVKLKNVIFDPSSKIRAEICHTKKLVFFFSTSAASPDVAGPVVNPVHGGWPGLTGQGAAQTLRPEPGSIVLSLTDGDLE